MDQTLCWECAKATRITEGNGDTCEWATAFKPVPGWTAEPTKKYQTRDNQMDSFLVTDCPKFERDAVDGGTRRPGQPKEKIRRYGYQNENRIDYPER